MCLSPANLPFIIVTLAMILGHRIAKEKIFPLPFIPYDHPKLQDIELMPCGFFYKVDLEAFWMRTEARAACGAAD